MVAPDNYHPPLHIDFKLTFDCQLTFQTPQRSHSQGDYLLLYNTFIKLWLVQCKKFCWLQFIILLLVCRRLSMKPFCVLNPKLLHFLTGFPKSLVYYIKKKNQFLRNIWNLILITITVFFHTIINLSKLLLRQTGWID